MPTTIENRLARRNTLRAKRRKRSLGVLARRLLASEPLEQRLVLHALSTGSGDGSVNLDVDGYGAFGGAVGGVAGQAIYDPIGSIGPSSTTFESGVAVRVGSSGSRQFLTSGSIGSSGGLPEPTVTGSLTSAISNFSLGQLNVQLTQTVAPTLDDNSVQTGSILVQSYLIQNTSSSSQHFEVIRYIDGDLFFDGTLVDGGGRIVVSGTEILFETDAGGTGSTDTTFLGIDANGGTIPANNRFEIDAYSGLESRIIAGSALDASITGDTNGDGFVDAGNEYDVTLALLNVFDLAPGVSATYTTRTVFGSGTPEDVPIGLPIVRAGPDLSVPEGASGITDLVVPITISGETATPLTVVYTTINGSATSPSDYQATSGTLTFLPGGATTQLVTIQIFGDIDNEVSETFVVRLSDVVGGQIPDPEMVVTILNDDVSASVADASAIERHTGTSSMVFSVSVEGFRSAPITLEYATIDGTANGGVDYVPVHGTLTFPVGTNTASVTVPVIGDILNEGNETFGLALFDLGAVKLAKGVGVGTIIDDDRQPALYVNDVQVKTTSAGALAAVFTVALDLPSGRAVRVDFGTLDGSALAGIDYVAQNGQLLIPPGTTNVQVTVPVTTSDLYSANELFALKLSNPDGAVMADALGVCTGVFAADPPHQYILDDNSPGYARSNYGWANVTNLVGYQTDYDYHEAGNGSAFARWTVANLAPGQYEVFARWVPFGNRATNAPYTIFDGATSRGTVAVNQQLAPSGDLENGITWQSLGTFQISTGILSVRLSDNANGFVIADAVRIVPNGIPAPVPEIDVAYLADSIDDEETEPTASEGTAFGNVLLFTDSPVHTFTIRNTGNAPLQLTGSPRVQVLGDDAGEFVVVNQPAAVVAPGATTSFSIVFRPAADGLRQAVVSIDSNDLDEGEYRFAIEGVGTDGDADSPAAQNFAQPLDVDGNLLVSPKDLLIVFNALLRQNGSSLEVSPLVSTSAAAGAASTASPGHYLDVDGNGILSPRDALLIVNHFLRGAEDAAPQATPASSAVVDGSARQVQVFAVDQAIGELAETDSAISGFVQPVENVVVALADVSGAGPLALADTDVPFALGDDEADDDELDLSWE